MTGDFDDQPRLTLELLRDIMDLRMALALGFVEIIDDRLERITAEIVGRQGKPAAVAAEYVAVFGEWDAAELVGSGGEVAT